MSVILHYTGIHNYFNDKVNSVILSSTFGKVFSALFAQNMFLIKK